MSDAAAAESGESTENQEASGGEESGSSESTEQVVERPGHIPEKFWDGEKGEANIENLGKSYLELEKKFNGKRDELISELEESRLASRPETADGYEVTTQEELLKLGISVDEENSMLAWWKGHSYDQGLSNEQFNEGLMAFAQAQLDATGAEAKADAEIERLGENGQERVEAVTKWMASALSEAEFNGLAAALTSAEAIVAVEKLMSQSQGRNMNVDGEQQGRDRMTEDKVRAMMNDPRYWDPGKEDRDFIERVNKAWESLHPA